MVKKQKPLKEVGRLFGVALGTTIGTKAIADVDISTLPSSSRAIVGQMPMLYAAGGVGQMVRKKKKRRCDYAKR